MPGIAGVISRRPAEACVHLVDQMIASMMHERLYVSGTYAAPELGVFGGWTALKDSFADCQPILNENGDIALLLSGECFSDAQTRTQLRQRGHRFEPNNAAWLIHLYEESGESFFSQLNGLFSGLLIDRRHRRAFVFNDRFGMERLYYHEAPDAFFFASEAKALLRILPDLRAFDQEGLAQFLRYGCTLESKTLFRNVAALPAASVWSVSSDRREKRSYFTPTTWESQPRVALDRFAEDLEASLTRVLPGYFESRGDIGISLTGGLDTRMIMACRSTPSQPSVAYTFAGPVGDTLDVRIASQVAAVCGMSHHVLRIASGFFSDFDSLADRTVYITDGDLGVCGAHEIYLNNQARDLASVRLTGNFGSEILRGVSTFKPLDLSADLLAYEYRQILCERDAAVSTVSHPVSFAAFREIPWHLSGIVKAAKSQVAWRTPYMDNDLVALAFRAPTGATVSSSPSLRVVRERDSALAAIRTDQGLVPSSRSSSLAGFLWYHTLFKLEHRWGDGLPRWLSFLDTRWTRSGLRHCPTGLHRYLYYARWFRRELAGYLSQRLASRAISENPLWNRRFVDRLAAEHTTGRKNYLSEINALLTVDAIERQLFRELS
jgi:asparagine synthase (glutamine-hydrolysing)